MSRTKVLRFSTEAMEGIAREVLAAFNAIPRRGAETGGLVLGRDEPGELQIRDFEPARCSHRYGPSFLLDEEDHKDLSESLAFFATDRLDALPVAGLYRSNTRGPAQLDPRDRDLFRQYFTGRESWFLLLQPARDQSIRAQAWKWTGDDLKPAGSDFAFPCPAGECISLDPTGAAQPASPALPVQAPPEPAVAAGRPGPLPSQVPPRSVPRPRVVDPVPPPPTPPAAERRGEAEPAVAAGRPAPLPSQVPSRPMARPRVMDPVTPPAAPPAPERRRETEPDRAAARPAPEPPPPATTPLPPPHPRMNWTEPEPRAAWKSWLAAAAVLIAIPGAYIGYRAVQPAPVEVARPVQRPVPVPEPPADAPPPAATEPANPEPAPTPVPPAAESGTAAKQEREPEEKPAPAERPKARADRDAPDARESVRRLLEDWAAAQRSGEARDVAEFYTPQVARYLGRRNLSRADVSNQVSAFIGVHGIPVIFRLSELRIEPAGDDGAVATFRKHWQTRGARMYAGEEQVRVSLVRHGNEWKIAAEDELRVYWNHALR